MLLFINIVWCCFFCDSDWQLSDNSCHILLDMILINGGLITNCLCNWAVDLFKRILSRVPGYIYLYQSVNLINLCTNVLDSMTFLLETVYLRVSSFT